MSQTASSRDSISRLYNASQIRVDTWSQLSYSTQALAETDATPQDRDRLKAEIGAALDRLEPIEQYWAFPGTQVFRRLRDLLRRGDSGALQRIVSRIGGALIGNTYRRHPIPLLSREDGEGDEQEAADSDREAPFPGPYFEVLIVDSASEEEERLRHGLHVARRGEDRFTYDVVVVPSLEDALIAVLFNPTLQSCIIHHGFRLRSGHAPSHLSRYLRRVEMLGIDIEGETDPSLRLARLIGELRPEIDCFLVSDLSVESVAGRTPPNVRRVFYSREDFLELHLNILRGVDERYKTPFFTALKEYSVQPTGVFHAMPISRGKSITKSHWIQDMAEFYGVNIFLAETSATSGGLDSLLAPQGPIKRAQERAAQAFGAQRTFFVTNGTSTANKIVLQALIRPNDIVLVDRNCHKSHHYGFVLTGARVCYLDAYPLNDYSMYGAVSLKTLKSALLDYKAAGLLDRVKMVTLTNCTFDGVVYNVDRVMQECLAIKPDLIFLWDEAWFAFARCDPMYRHRTGMDAARRLRQLFRSDGYRRRYAEFAAGFGDPDPTADRQRWLETPLLPDPDRARVRVYATQSTHKTLTSLRQGSMIHVWDQDYGGLCEEAFMEAFMTHTSTSPNYQIIASMDVGRRQVQLEGFELVQKQTEMSMTLRQRIVDDPLLSRFFEALTVTDMIPPEFRESGLERYYDEEHGWAPMMEAWMHDEFVLDPCRLTLSIGKLGVDGDTFKNLHLMEQHGIQINKTSRNTVLFMSHIGTTRSSVAYLIDVLVRIAREMEERLETMSAAEHGLHEQRVRELTVDLPPLPDFSCFHPAFGCRGGTRDGDIRRAYFLAMEEKNCRYVRLSSSELESGALVSSKFIIPYPPGFPLLVPGQLITADTVEYMRRLDTKEIHGYQERLGLRVFREEVLEALAQGGN